MRAVAEVVPDVLPRLRAVAREVDDTRDHLAALLELRNRIIVEAEDAGISQRAVAEAAKIRQSRVIRIVAELDGVST